MVCFSVTPQFAAISGIERPRFELFPLVLAPARRTQGVDRAAADGNGRNGFDGGGQSAFSERQQDITDT